MKRFFLTVVIMIFLAASQPYIVWIFLDGTLGRLRSRVGIHSLKFFSLLCSLGILSSEIFSFGCRRVSDAGKIRSAAVDKHEILPVSHALEA